LVRSVPVGGSVSVGGSALSTLLGVPHSFLSRRVSNLSFN